jgi:hypothetical protein
MSVNYLHGFERFNLQVEVIHRHTTRNLAHSRVQIRRVEKIYGQTTSL